MLKFSSNQRERERERERERACNLCDLIVAMVFAVNGKSMNFSLMFDRMNDLERK